MAMSFELTQRQRGLRAQSRAFARDVLRDARATAEVLPTAEERFIATRPVYERLVAEGFLRACIPQACGGDNQSLIDTAVVIEELYCENPSVALTLLGTVLGLAPVVVGGSAEQRKRLLTPFLERSGAPLAAFCSTEPGGSANAAAPAPGEGVRGRCRSLRWRSPPVASCSTASSNRPATAPTCCRSSRSRTSPPRSTTCWARKARGWR